MAVVAALIAPQAVPVAAAQVQVAAGAQSGDKGNQLLAFLPNELWVHVNDSVTWAFPTPEIHTVTFLRPSQIRPPFPVGCPGTTPDGSPETGATCVNSGPLAGGASYTVNFPTAGNFKLVCLVHSNMTGVVHVLGPAETLPHDQAFYNREARQERSELLADGARLAERGTAIAERTFREQQGNDEGNNEGDHDRASGAEVTAGIGEIVAPSGGGTSTVSVMRFLRGRIVVRVGQTVEWTNLDPITPHTVTFGTEPLNPIPASPDVAADSDGSRHAVLVSPGHSTHSGFLNAEPQERVGLPQSEPGPVPPKYETRFRVTFMSPGTYTYICALHDELGMTGTVKVVP
jgi:plastocyanin